MRMILYFVMVDDIQIVSISYPVVSIIAKNLLIVQVSTVVIKSAFRIEGHLIDDHMPSIDPTTVCSVIYFQD